MELEYLQTGVPVGVLNTVRLCRSSEVLARSMLVPGSFRTPTMPVTPGWFGTSSTNSLRRLVVLEYLRILITGVSVVGRSTARARTSSSRASPASCSTIKAVATTLFKGPICVHEAPVALSLRKPTTFLAVGSAMTRS
ncbi:MAG: hypothetical protein A4E30_00099 [Methanomassiliicoccales archaeon PtaB.Bin215]|nr:MAG: hypothetical protein A4E30_00099 [Methanomassiliicoccales archaeon PtaB.Bin215]